MRPEATKSGATRPMGCLPPSPTTPGICRKGLCGQYSSKQASRRKSSWKNNSAFLMNGGAKLAVFRQSQQPASPNPPGARRDCPTSFGQPRRVCFSGLSVVCFAQADSIIPLEGQGVQACPLRFTAGVLRKDRYAGMNNNPVRYNNPSGHRACDDLGCDGEIRYKKRTSPPPPPQPPQPQSTNQACTGTNWSVVCKDPTLVSSGQVQTPAVYPTYQTPDIYDGPYADESCVHPVLCGLLLLADIVTGAQYQSNIPAHIGNNYVYANVNYEVHSEQYGNYTVVTGLEISSSTNAVLSLESIHVDDYAILRPTTPIAIKPNQTVIIPVKFMAGSSISLNLDSQIYNLMSLLAIFP